jgi:hypothetical protein
MTKDGSKWVFELMVRRFADNKDENHQLILKNPEDMAFELRPSTSRKYKVSKMTPLHMAILVQRLDMINILLSVKSEVKITSAKGALVQAYETDNLQEIHTLSVKKVPPSELLDWQMDLERVPGTPEWSSALKEIQERESSEVSPWPWRLDDDPYDDYDGDSDVSSFSSFSSTTDEDEDEDGDDVT